MSGAERRALLDRFRKRAGLDTTTDIDARRRFEAANRNARLIAAQESPWQICAEPTCNEIPINELGAPIPVDARRWWCPAHRHLADEGDMLPRPIGLRIAPSGAIVPVDPDEEARGLVAAESRRHQHEAKLADRKADAQELASVERARRARVERELPPHLRPRKDAA
jgi:hypothetical protein